ncbi:MAG: argF, partial [Dehalococcoidia bacterium]|nr:argF [Dehalococcoidia bacterium]
MLGKDLTSVLDMTAEDIWRLTRLALALKAQEDNGDPLKGRCLALLFEKPSLRTKVSFDVAMWQLGGHSIYLSPAEVGLGEREGVADVAPVLSRMVSGIAARTFAHSTVELLARHATVPVINALSDLEHPCQALGDFLTIQEMKGEVADLSIAYVGDGNNVANSLLYMSAIIGIDFRCASPKGYALD